MTFAPLLAKTNSALVTGLLSTPIVMKSQIQGMFSPCLQSVVMTISALLYIILFIILFVEV